MLGDSNDVIFSTGNVLGLNKKAGQKAAEELFDCLKATLSDPADSNKIDKIFLRKNDDLHSKVSEHKREDIKIGAKVFLNKSKFENLGVVIDNLLKTLGVDCLDNLILAYHPKDHVITNGLTNGNEPHSDSDTGNDNKEGVIEWGGGVGSSVKHLKQLWNVLENYADKKKICQLGIADLDTDTLKELYESSHVKPTIAQINLSACCIVPPSLQEFCNSHDIQLLTHSDPQEIVSKTTFNELDVPIYTPTWTARYQVHVKCRGVLAAKGFIVGAEK